MKEIDIYGGFLLLFVFSWRVLANTVFIPSVGWWELDVNEWSPRLLAS